MSKDFKLMSSCFLMALTLATPRSSHAMATEMNFTGIPEEVRGLVIRQAAHEQFLDNNTLATLNKPLDNLTLVCKEWEAIICKEWEAIINDERIVNMPSWKAWYGVTSENEHIYQQFLNGTLIYRPDPQSDEEMITLKISDLPNPLEGTFDLSGCGDAAQYLSISTGYRKGKKSENSNKLEIWLAPRFMIEKKIQLSAPHLQPIMANSKEEKAPIGILWTWGGWEDLSWYEYSTEQSAQNVSSKNLYAHSRPTWRTYNGIWRDDRKIHNIRDEHIRNEQRLVRFMFICEPK